MKEDHYPNISVVIIGLNSALTLKRCIEAALATEYPMPPEIIYVDGGSEDNSLHISRSFPSVITIENDPSKTPIYCQQRNLGWNRAKGEWIQFLDSDMFMDKNWIKSAICEVDDNTAAIFGQTREMSPDKNLFHYVANLEWTKPVDNPKFFGGGVLTRRKALEGTGGYLCGLRGGEEPELAARIRACGWKIKGVNILMCLHDINTNTWKRYLLRSKRSGRAYLEAGIYMWKNGERSWIYKALRIIIKVLLVLSLLLSGILSSSPFIFLIGTIVALHPFFEVFLFMKKFKINFKGAVIYALHCSIVVWPQFFGMIGFICDKIGDTWKDLFKKT